MTHHAQTENSGIVMKDGNAHWPTARKESREMPKTDKEKQAEKRLHQAILIQQDPIVSGRMWQDATVWKVEKEWKASFPNTPEYTLAIRMLTVFYLELNRMLTAACLEMGYPLLQWEWEESDPLTVMSLLFPGIETLEWYQTHLSVMVMPPTEPHHLWWNLPAHKEKVLENLKAMDQSTSETPNLYA